MKKERLYCLDLLRGLDMFYLAVVTVILEEVFKLWPALKEIKVFGHQLNVFLAGHPWYGYTLYDWIMPLFIFMCGAAAPFALEKRLGEHGEATASFFKHVILRVILLWILGAFVQGDLASVDPMKISFYSNTLQAIACGYFFTAMAMLLPKMWWRVAIAGALVVAYGFIIHLGGDYTKDGNITQIVALKLMRAVHPAESNAIKYTETYGYTWTLPSMMFVVLSMGGYFATKILQRVDWVPYKRAAMLGVYGALTLGVGFLLTIWIPSVKHFYSVSFTLRAIGNSVLALGALYVITDIWKWRKGLSLFILFGQFALTAYFCESALRYVVYTFNHRLLWGVYALIPSEYESLFKAVAYAVTVCVILYLRKRIKAR